MPEFSFDVGDGSILHIQCLEEKDNKGENGAAIISFTDAMEQMLKNKNDNEYGVLCRYGWLHSSVTLAMRSSLDDCKDRLQAQGWIPVECGDRSYSIPIIGKNVNEYLRLGTTPEEDLVLFSVMSYKVQPVTSTRLISVIAMCRTRELADVISQLATMDAIVGEPPINEYC